MKKLLVILLVVTMIFSFAACGGSDNPAGTDPGKTVAKTEEAKTTTTTGNPELIRVGVSCPLTGNYATTGIRIQQALNIAVKEVNDAGGILGRQVEIVINDDQGDATYAVNVANKLVSEGVCAILGTNLTGTTKACMPIWEKAGIPYISSGSSPALIVEGNKYFFRIACPDNEVVALGAKYMGDTYGNKKVACIHDTNDYGQAACDVLEKYCKDNGIEFKEAGYNQGDTDLSGQILTIAEFKPDFVYLAAQETEIAICVRQMHELGIDIPTLGASSLGNKYCQDLLTEEELVGKHIITDVIPMSGDEIIGAFFDKFKATYNVDLDRNGSMFYSSFYCLMDAIKRAGSDDSDAIRDALLQTKNFPTVVGELECDEVGQIQHNGIIGQVTAGKVMKIVGRVKGK